MEKQKFIKRHTKGFIVAHWVNAVSFFMLFLTALPLYADSFKFVYDALGPHNLQMAHRVFAVIFVLNPIVALLTNGRSGFKRLFSEVLHFTKRDIQFMLKFGPELIGKEPKDMPKQGFYNGGEKANIMFQMFVWAVMIISGGILWLGAGVIPSTVRTWMIPIHSLFAGVGLAAAFGHIFLAAVVNPESVHGMKDGTVDLAYAEKHHTEWVDKLVEEGKVSQQDIDSVMK